MPKKTRVKTRKPRPSPAMDALVMNYDPNLVLCGRMAYQRVKVTFGEWDYRAEFTVTVGGNCRGLTVIESAVGIVFDKLPIHRFKATSIVLERANGDKLEVEDDEDKGERWLKKMLISAEIISIKPETTDFTGPTG